MLTERKYLIDKLMAAGIETTIITEQKKLEKSNEMHVGAVIFDKSTYKRNGSKKTYEDKSGVSCVRTKVFDRIDEFKVIIGEYTPEACEKIVDTFVSILDNGPKIRGNHVQVELAEAVWLDDEDSILKSKMTCEMRITFSGGVYSDHVKKERQLGAVNMK